MSLHRNIPLSFLCHLCQHTNTNRTLPHRDLGFLRGLEEKGSSLRIHVKSKPLRCYVRWWIFCVAWLEKDSRIWWILSRPWLLVWTCYNSYRYQAKFGALVLILHLVWNRKIVSNISKFGRVYLNLVVLTKSLHNPAPNLMRKNRFELHYPLHDNEEVIPTTML